MTEHNSDTTALGNPDFFDVFFDLAESGLADIRRGFGGWIPEVYDLMEGDFEDDIPLVLDLAAQTGGPVVDLGAGTGRLTLPLAEAGFHVTAVDSDPAMQDILQRKSESLSLAGSVTVLNGDIRSFNLSQPASLAVCSTNTFLYLGSLDEQRVALENISKNLKSGGRLWLDVFVPKPNPSADEPYLTSFRDPDTGLLLLYGAQSREDHFRGKSHVNAFTIVFGRSPTPEIYVQSWDYAWITPNEMRLLLESCGFELESLNGDYDNAPADEYSVQMVALARKI